MSSLSDFFRIKLFNTVEEPISEKHGLTEYGVKNYVDAMVANVSGTGGGGTTEEINYDAITIARWGEDYPLTQTRGDAQAVRQGRYLWDNWDAHYSKCNVRLTVNGQYWYAGSTYEAGPFATKDTLYTWVNSVIPNNGSSVIGHARIEIYDELGDVPALQKVYGYNNLFAAFAGAGNQKRGAVKTAVEGGNWLWDMFTALTTYFKDEEGLLDNVTTGATIQADNPNNRKIFWLPASKRNLYGLPKVGNYITLSDTVPADFRKWWNETTVASVNQVTGDAGGHVIAGRVFVVMNSAQSWQVLNYDDSDIDWFGGTQSIVEIYLIKHYADDGRFAFFAKPVGIDTVLVDWFDQDTYRLEAIAFNKDRQPNLRHVSTSQSTGRSDFYGDRTVVLKNGWLFDDSKSLMSNTGFVIPRKVGFRLRRLSDNKVGPLTTARIKPIVNTTGAKMKWIVS